MTCSASGSACAARTSGNRRRRWLRRRGGGRRRAGGHAPVVGERGDDLWTPATTDARHAAGRVADFEAEEAEEIVSKVVGHQDAASPHCVAMDYGVGHEFGDYPLQEVDGISRVLIQNGLHEIRISTRPSRPYASGL